MGRSKMGGAIRFVLMAVAWLVTVGALAMYWEARRARRNDFPFQWGPLFAHGLLLVALGAALAVLVVLAVRGGWLFVWLAAIGIGGPGLLLTVAPYVAGGLPSMAGGLELDWFPQRWLVANGYHELGMTVIGLALGLLVAYALFGGRVAPEAPAETRESVEA